MDSEFFTRAPQEFFASISNQYFDNTFKTLELAVERFKKGYKEPINQFLFFAEVYSLGEATAPFYRLDEQGNIEVSQVEVTRDALGHIIQLKVRQKTYGFTLDNNGNVIDLKVS